MDLSICAVACDSVGGGGEQGVALTVETGHFRALYSMNNQQMQLYAVNFIPLLGSLCVFRAFYTPIIRSTILKSVSTATGTDHSIVSATYSQRGLQATLGVSS